MWTEKVEKLRAINKHCITILLKQNGKFRQIASNYNTATKEKIKEIWMEGSYIVLNSSLDNFQNKLETVSPTRH